MSPYLVCSWGVVHFRFELAQHAKPLIECELNELWKGELDLELQSLDGLWQHLQTVDDQLEKIAQQNESVKLLQTIPGVGRRTEASDCGHSG